MGKIKNEFIQGTAHVRQIGDKAREARLRCYGHMKRRNTEYIGKRMLCLELSGKRRRGRLKMRFMDVLREDMQVVGVSDEQEKLETSDPLWQPLMGAAKRKRVYFKENIYTAG